MVRLIGIDLPRNKRIEYALTYIHGIGLTSAKIIVQRANISPVTRTDDLTNDETMKFMPLKNLVTNSQYSN